MSSLAPAKPRRRLSRESRRLQLIEVAWGLAREEGADALTLGRLAEQAGVAKPVVYDHFGTRSGLLAALFEDFDLRQTAAMDAALAASEPTLVDRARVIAEAYVGCALDQGRELAGVAAALEGSPELESVKRRCEAAFLEKCRAALDPFAPGGVSTPALVGALGAADALSRAAAAGEIDADPARAELLAVILAAVERSRGPLRQPA
ncbi:TetR/AcrR family transcriptional regulator [Methylopila sp. Yamaguchi]|uniref:TetR/AcrR family transcriptional regulator n=1 Tax=Methylopila sp. Yamaguchi TaxID=1437817 RepID=UPI000CCA9285|nr:TetR/AcrR family transcriptional regulator [Methylopila sp. Yamaguchi]GBD50790.1 TetR family transcriptional regulator [Methylopila sp. Yamaguchi]